jgi:allantoinase
LAGLGHRKGQLAVGYDADLVLWDDEATFEVGTLRHRHGASPYLGQKLHGIVQATLVGGRVAYSESDGLASRPVGRFVAAQ